MCHAPHTRHLIDWCSRSLRALSLSLSIDICSIIALPPLPSIVIDDAPSNSFRVSLVSNVVRVRFISVRSYCQTASESQVSQTRILSRGHGQKAHFTT